MVQEQILQQNTDLDIPVYLIWMPVLRQYTAEEIDGAKPKLMKRFHDPRFVHYWDGTDTIGRYVRKHLIPDYTKRAVFWDSGEVVWDAFVLFGGQGKWAEAKGSMKGWGRTIQGAFDELKRLVGEAQK